jgi:ABC-type transport system involved in multi-copper enzyme maturation permease subunit
MTILENPVLIKEVKTKMRSRQPARVQAAIGAIIGLFVLYCYYQALAYIIRFGGSNGANDGWSVGLWVQAILIWILAPALTANAISQEKEQQTWEMLLFTLLTPPEILFGKLIARMVPMVALMVAFFPFMLFCFARGTLSPGVFFTTYSVLAVWIFFLTVVGLFMSWAFRKTATSIATAYLVVFALVIGTVLVNMTLSMGQSWIESWVWWLNPIRITNALTDIKTDPHAPGVLWLSSITFISLALFLIWRMVYRFRAFSID